MNLNCGAAFAADRENINLVKGVIYMDYGAIPNAQISAFKRQTSDTRMPVAQMVSIRRASRVFPMSLAASSRRV